MVAVVAGPTALAKHLIAAAAKILGLTAIGAVEADYLCDCVFYVVSLDHRS